MNANTVRYLTPAEPGWGGNIFACGLRWWPKKKEEGPRIIGPLAACDGTTAGPNHGAGVPIGL